jgi:hypothetical protein
MNVASYHVLKVSTHTPLQQGYRVAGGRQVRPGKPNLTTPGTFSRLNPG